MTALVRPPTQAEIEEAIKKIHSANNTTNPPNPIDAGNSEIGDALKQFEKEQGNIIKPQTSDTVDVMRSQRIEIPQDSEPSSKMVKHIMKLSGGVVKDQRQAEYVMLGVVIVFMSISLYLFFGRGGGSGAIDPNLPYPFNSK